MNARESLVLAYATVYVRLGLAVGFLSAVADRFGVWGPPGSEGVAWGEFGHFLAYTEVLNPQLPAAWIPTVGWAVTGAEVAFGVALVVGWRIREVAYGSAVLLLLFALGMAVGTGVKSSLDASVFAASGAALLLAGAPRYPFSLDEALSGEGGPR